MNKKELINKIVKFYEIDPNQLIKLNKDSLFLMYRVMNCYKYKEVINSTGFELLNTSK